ncbi:MAG: hypothetical protein ACRELV_04870 [Longimicrobiales bacterium]
MFDGPSGLLPWEIHPALTEARLVKVGRLAWAARQSAAEDAKWEMGDYLWDIGCKAYVRTKHAIAMASKGDLADYLSFELDTLFGRFVFKIGGVPIRFYRGDPEETAPQKYAYATPRELLSLQLAFDVTDTPTPDAYFRLVVETDKKGFPIGSTLVQVDDQGKIQNPWPIPVGPTSGVRDIAVARDQAVRLPPPPVGRETEDDEAADNETENGNTNEEMGGV